MREALALALAGGQSLAHDPTRERVVDRLGAIGAAQILRAEDAKGEAFLISLGRDAIAFKFANDPRSREPCETKLIEVMGWQQFRKRHRLGIRDIPRVSKWAITEYVIDFCPTCSGRGEIPMVGIGEGPQPTKTCPSCNGNKWRRYTTNERQEAVQTPRVNEGVDTALQCLQWAEHLALRATKIMLERWGGLTT